MARIAEIGFTSEDRVREVIHNCNRDGFGSLTPNYAGGRPYKFDPDIRAEIGRVALTQPKTVDKPWTRWSLPKLCDFLVEVGWSKTSRSRQSAGSSTNKACRFNG